jgi:hypothetical protein
MVSLATCKPLCQKKRRGITKKKHIRKFGRGIIKKIPTFRAKFYLKTSGGRPGKDRKLPLLNHCS